MSPPPAVQARLATRHALLAGVSLSAFGIVLGPAQAASPRPLSPGWLAARVDASTSSVAASGTAAGTLAQVSAATQNLALLAARLNQIQSAERAAAAAAATVANTVPNGLALGGLWAAPGATPGSALWMGAGAPTQSTTSGLTTVAVKQTAAQASLTWQTFNVGSKTRLSFDQSAGGSNASNWVVLNRVEDPAAAPSQILGSITAPGKVFVINANGIIFGGGAQVNVGSLIASTASISDAQFASGIYGAPISGGDSFTPSFTGAAADSVVTVQAGARIATPAPASVTSGGGYVMLLGGAVENDGAITTPQGQTVLAAGEDFILRAGYSSTSNQAATVLGSQVATDKGGSAVNAGLITSDLGDITMVGQTVTQAGVALSTTSVNTRGTIHLLTPDSSTARVILAPGSVTSVDPDNGSATALDSQRDSLISQSLLNDTQRNMPVSAANPQLNDVSTLSDRLDLSRVEVTTGGVAEFDDGSLTLSQGGQIAVQAAGQAWIGSGAQLDVSGSTGAVLAASSNALSVTIEGNELRDAPVNRDTGLIVNNTVSVDIRDLLQVAAGTGGDANIRDYTAGGLLEVGGYLANTGHTIDEWAAVGGTITLNAASVVTQSQSTLNIAGGSVAVRSGELAQSYVIGTDGRLYNVNTAPANIDYAGVYNGFVVDHPRWGYSQAYYSPLVAPAQQFQNGYSYGRDAGSVIVLAPTAALEGTIEAGASNGIEQTDARASGITDGYAYTPNSIALPGTLAVGGFAPVTGALLDPVVTIADAIVPIADTIDAGGKIIRADSGRINLSATQLNNEALGGLSVTTGRSISVDDPLTLAPGGTLTLNGATIKIGADLTARGGRIDISNVVTNPVTDSIVAIVPLPTAKQPGGVVINQHATIDLRGEFTNVVIDPASAAGLGLMNGGTLAIDSVSGLRIGNGTRLDASSGGAVQPGGTQAGGVGGDILLTGDDPAYSNTQGVVQGAVLIGSSFRDYGVNGGGTFSLTAPGILVGTPLAPPLAGTVELAPQLFLSGFNTYVVNGFDRVDVAPGTIITAAELVYVLYNDGGVPVNVPSGKAPAAVYQLLLPPIYSENKATGRLTQRQGASIEFLSDETIGATPAGGTIDLGAGSVITVDPLQSVRISAYGQITDDATIVAHGGEVSIVNTEQNLIGDPNAPTPLSLSVWIGGDASIDVSGQAVTALDALGRTYGVVTAGGTINLGSDGGLDATTATRIATDAQILVRPGAVLDVSGSSATIDLLAGTGRLGLQDTALQSDPVTISTDAGTISLSSYSGISLDGTLLAAGGAGAAGGTLSMTLESPVFNSTITPVVPDELRVPRILTISTNAKSAVDGDTMLQAGAPIPIDSYGHANISQQQISDAGFYNVSLFARDVFRFLGDVALHDAGSISLYQGILTAPPSPLPVTITAPYVHLSGETAIVTPDNGSSTRIVINDAAWMPSKTSAVSSLIVSADLIDIDNAVRLGVHASLDLTPVDGTTPVADYDYSGFADLALDSTADIRFGNGSITTPGNVELSAAQLYPVTGATAAVYAGYDEYSAGTGNIYTPTGSITVARPAGAAMPAVPFSVGGNLALYAGVIVQDGVIRAPEGTITLGSVGQGPDGLLLKSSVFNSFSYSVTLLPGSVTSVSLDGLSVPYGGTEDGVSYTYNGVPVAIFNPAIALAGQVQTVEAGAVLDLSGGGELAGAGFISGRGGSTDVLTAPLLSFDAASARLSSPSLSAAPVYAIVPGYASGFAPISPLEASSGAGSVPVLGSRITIGSGVPGIAPGTYTLLPSYYALLPGAARVQINTGAYDATPGVTPLGAGSYELNATTSTVFTPTMASAPVDIIVTTAAGVALNAQFDQESYTSFELGQAAQFGTPRAALPGDAKTLNLIVPATAATSPAFTFDGTALMDGAAGYRGGTATLGGLSSADVELEITADGAVPTAGFTAVAASQLNALGASSLVIGGTLAAGRANEIDVLGNVGSVVIRNGATLATPQIVLTAAAQGSGAGDGSITVEGGATLDTVGAGAAPYDSTDGYFFNTNGFTSVAVSNGLLVFTPSITSTTAFGAIDIEDGASLLTAGTINFATDAGLSLGTQADYGARYLSIDLANINVLSEADAKLQQAGSLVLPSGLVLTQDVLTRLLAGDPARGIPALQTLVLTATQSINFDGSVSLDTLDPKTGLSTLQQFVLNTPAIYGYGGAGDTATIATGTLYWNGIETTLGTQNVSALPGGVVAGGPGTGTGALTIDAQNIVLGYGPDTTPDDQVTLDRVIEGFATVNLTASQSISANARGSLSVYEVAGSAPGDAGTGGVLNISTPVLTGAAASVDSITAGDTLNLTAPASTTAPATGALGAQIDLSAATINDDTTILLNSGRLTMNTSGDLLLGSAARIDLSGQTVSLLDQTRYSSGGSLLLASSGGNITADPESVIGVAATGAEAGSVQATAEAGTVDLQGAIDGSAPAAAQSGTFSVRAGTLADFDGLNHRLSQGGVFGSRGFEIGSGSLLVDQTVQAQTVNISVDSGSLTVSGVIDASGAAPGQITLSAGQDLVLADGALLDAHGSVPQVDSHGLEIDSENRAIVALSSTGGTLRIDRATIDVAAPGIPLGLVTLTAARIADTSGGPVNDIAVDASGPIDIEGAQTIALYGNQTYTPTDGNGTIEQHADPEIQGALSLDQINGDNAAFLTLASANPELAARIAGLVPYGSALHVRPADTIQSSDASHGNLTVNGDLDLSSLRYGANNTEVGLLSLRAANNLIVNGSISDGFATPPDAVTATKDDNGWVLYSAEPLGQNVTLPNDLNSVVLASGTTFSTRNSVALNYDITIGAATLQPDVVIPAQVVTQAGYKIPAGGYTATATITGPNGVVIATPGQILAAGSAIPKGSTLGIGTVLPFAVSIAAGTNWPAGSLLSLFTGTLSLDVGKAGLALAGGAFIPSGSDLKLISNGKPAKSVALRPKGADGRQGLIYAVAPMLPSGSASWSINLVGGANLASADVLAVQPATSLANAAPAADNVAGSVILDDLHYTDPGSTATPSFSVVRTGTGMLNVVAGGNVDEASLYGVYTAGTPTTLGAQDDALFQAGRATQGDGTVLGKSYAAYNTVIAGQQQYYPDQGGNVLVSAQNDVLGDIIGANAQATAITGTDSVGNWLWKQGGAGIGQSTAWWINFGSYVLPLNADGTNNGSQPALAGFTGIGALGGGNVTVLAGGDAGETSTFSLTSQPISTGLVIAVASTGRVVDASGTSGSADLALTGGGRLTLDVAGTINPTLQIPLNTAISDDGLGGTLTDMRGDIDVQAGQVGRIDLLYGLVNVTDPRPLDPFTAGFSAPSNGLILVQGDGTAAIDTMRDLVLAGAGDAGRESEQALTAIPADLVPPKNRAILGGQTGFSLWTDATAIDLFSAGGNLTPISANASTAAAANPVNDPATDLRFIYPGTVDAVAASGSFYYGSKGQANPDDPQTSSLELAPTPDGQLAFLAERSIFAGSYAVDMSGAATGVDALPNPFNPAYLDDPGNAQSGIINFTLNADLGRGPNSLFAFELDTPTTDLHAGDSQPVRFYAATGDLVDVQSGEVLVYDRNSLVSPALLYLAAKPAWLMAGRDIVASGTRPVYAQPSLYPLGTSTTFPNQVFTGSSTSTGDLLLNNNSTDVSVISAGRDILSTYAYIAGPGTLEVDAGRNINDTGGTALDFGLIKSLGLVAGATAAARDLGASIAVLTGTGSLGPDETQFARLYFDPANQADLSIPLTDPANQGKVQQTYQVQLLAFLRSQYGYTGTAANALATFLALPPTAQDVFIRLAFFNELLTSGRQESDPASLFYKSYARGRTAIATLFPTQDSAGNPISYSGGLTMDSGKLANLVLPGVTFDAGISTLFGGSIQILSPGGGDVFGVAGGVAPGANSGVITFGDGDVDIYALDSVLLGQSRIFTTFGGNILIWSAEGDINAGRGAKTTTVEQPPLIAYDSFGDITLSPTAPTAGAGIATLAPIAGTIPGDVDLIAPLGTVDAGEAGIRVSGNLNIAALTVLNAANVSVGGKTTGNTAVATTSVAAATAAAAAAGSSIDAATTTQQKPRQQVQDPSVITVEIIGDNDTQSTRRRPAA